MHDSKTSENEATRKWPTAIPGSDLYNVERFVDLNKDSLCFNPAKGWMFWNGKVWKGDSEHKAFNGAEVVARTLQAEASTATEDDQYKRLIGAAKQAQKKAGLSSVVSLAENNPAIRKENDLFDRGKWALNCQNGIVDLRNGSLHPHNPATYCTRISPAEYKDDQSYAPRWLQFIGDVSEGIPGMASYLQRVAGYCLSGSISEKCFFFCYGSGDNGKSVFIEVIHELLGDYALALSTQTLIKNRFSAPIPNDIARLDGPRLATVSETQKGEEWNDALIKDLTGGDIITARFLKKEYFDFRPQCKLIIRGNNKPNINDMSSGMWRRLQLIPFAKQFPLEKQNKDLRELIVRHEMSGVLQWAVEGCIEWKRIGLAPPQFVLDAVAEFRGEMDIIGQFIQQRCALDESNTLMVKAQVLYEAYKVWCGECGHKPVTLTVFGPDITARNFPRCVNKKGTHYKGVILRDPSSEQDESEVDEDSW